MVTVHLDKMRIKKLNFNHEELFDKLEAKGRCSINIWYAPERCLCRCEYGTDIEGTGASQNFRYEILAEGYFTYDPEATKKEIHIAVAEEMSVQLQKLSDISLRMYGLSSIQLPHPQLSEDEINVKQAEDAQ